MDGAATNKLNISGLCNLFTYNVWLTFYGRKHELCNIQLDFYDCVDKLSQSPLCHLSLSLAQVIFINAAELTCAGLGLSDIGMGIDCPYT